MKKLETLEHFYSRILSWDNLVKKGSFDITKDIKDRDIESVQDNPYAKYGSLFAGDFDMKALVKNKNTFNYVKKYTNSNLKKEIPTIPILYTVPKDKKTRRQFKYPNFYSYCSSINVILNSENKKKIIDSLIKDKHSMSNFFGYSPYNYQLTHRIQDYILIGHSNFFKTDFTNFYPSFYSHAIAWLTMGKNHAKKCRKYKYLGNQLDKVIELEQDGETHGVPTGNLVTRIIVEYAMSFFDKELESKFNGTTISFYRYVDDFYFGYDNPKDLVTIDESIRELAYKYGFSINSKKTINISYNEINRGSQLIGFFSGFKINLKNTIPSVKKLLGLFNRYYVIANEEMIAGIKGSNKLILTSLQYFLSSLKGPVLKNALNSLVYVRSSEEFPFLLKLIQLVLNNSNISENFVHLLEEIQKKEKTIWNKPTERVVTVYLNKVFNSEPLNSRVFNRLLNYVEENKSEEAYFIFILMQKLDWNLSLKQLEIIFQVRDKDSEIDKKEARSVLNELDDYSWIKLFKQLLFNIKTNSKNEMQLKRLLPISKSYLKISYSRYFLNKNWTQDINLQLFYKLRKKDEKIIEIIKQIYLILYDIDISNYFGESHWLLKYELMFAYKNTNFNIKVQELYSSLQGKQLKSLPGNDKFKNIFSPNAFKNDSASKVNKFYSGLIDRNFSFTNFLRKFAPK